MLQKLKSFIKGLFSKAKPSRTQPTVKVGDKVGEVTILAQYQLDKHTPFKPGETYRLGEAIVTVHANKASMRAAIAATDARREAREARLKEKAIKLMLMTTDELKAYKLEEWLLKRNVKKNRVQAIMGDILSQVRYLPPGLSGKSEPPSGLKDERTAEAFKEVMKDVKVKEKA